MWGGEGERALAGSALRSPSWQGWLRNNRRALEPGGLPRTRRRGPGPLIITHTHWCLPTCAVFLAPTPQLAPQGPKTLSYNPAENCLLITSDVDGGSYELYQIPKEAARGDTAPVRAPPPCVCSVLHGVVLSWCARRRARVCTGGGGA